MFFNKLNYGLNNSFSYFWRRKKTFEIETTAVSGSIYTAYLNPIQASQTKKVKLDNSSTAIIIIDPWNYLNEIITQNLIKREGITQNKIIPLVKKFLERDFPIYIGTQKCAKDSNINCGVHKDFPKSKNIKFVYHSDETSESIANKLRKKGINNLIYLGFSSNQCLLGSRKISMIPMYHKNFKIYFIPEASDALDPSKSFSKGLMHELTTITISQWVGKILDFDEVFEELDQVSNYLKN